MDRRKNGEEHSQLLNDSAFSENDRDFFLQPEDNNAFSENFEDEDHVNGNAPEDEEIVLRDKNRSLPDETWTPVESTKRYAEVFRCSYPLENARKRWSDHTDFRMHSINIASDFHDEGPCDETQTLLPPRREDSADDVDQSRDSFMSNSEGGDLAEDEESSEDSNASNPPLDLTLTERLLRTHPVWFLPGIQRAGAVHLLQGKEEGNFIVRGSSQKDTMAISVRLPQLAGPYIEHYLILSQSGALSLESSRFKFESIPSLIAHYAQCCDELPVQLALPWSLMEVNNRQQLSSLALLGQEFWRCSITSPRSPDPPTIKSPTTATSGIFSGPQTATEPRNEVCDTPASDTNSTMSSFAIMGPPNGQAPLASPMSVDDSVLSPTSTSSVEFGGTATGIIGKTSTFKMPASRKSDDRRSSLDSSEHSQSPNRKQISSIVAELNARTRPAPPNTLNLRSAPPAPPPRWSKILMGPSVSNVEQQQIDAKNFTVITTVTFSVDNGPQADKNPFSTVKRLSPEGECQTEEEPKAERRTSDTPSNKSHRRSKRKESKHYQESDILESVYCRSNVQDKVSDYEDLWGNDAINSPIGKTMMSSFRSNASKKPMEREAGHKKSQLVLTPVDIPIASTNPFAYKLHHSSNNIHALSSPDNGNFVRHAINRLSLDLSDTLPSHELTFGKPNKDWSPFYANPADALDEFEESSLRRHHGSDTLKRPETEEKRRGIALEPWIADTSWEYVMQNLTLRHQKPEGLKVPEERLSSSRKPSSLHLLIAEKAPELHVDELVLPHVSSLEEPIETEVIQVYGRNNRVSSYDNVDRQLYASSATYSDEGTVFSEPWDNSQWERMIPDKSSATINFSRCKSVLGSSDDNTTVSTSTLGRQTSKTATISRNRSYRQDKGVLCHPNNRTSGSPSELVEAYALELARNRTSTFSKNIENFIACTKESNETAPQVVMRNMRQFMSGMKNYLVKHGEADFQQEVQRASSKLKPDEFINLDTILEGVMHRLVVLPLKQHLYNLFIDFYSHSGDLRLLIDNIRLASEKTLADFGIHSSIATPSAPELIQISLLFHRIQEADLPLEKLDLLFTIVSCIFDTAKVSRNEVNADYFLPLLIYTVSKCGFVGAEIEAEFMWGLLDPSLRSGEAGYYLTTLGSAVHILKNLQSELEPEILSSSASTSSVGAANCTLRSSVLKVIIPDEVNGSLQKRTLPVRPNTTTKDLCRIIAHKARITNPQDYGLFKLVNGEETLLQDNEYPQEVAILCRDKSFAFAYKRIDAKIGWPTEFL